MSRSVLPGVALGAVVTALFALGGGCLTRPVVRGNPQTSTNFTLGYSTTAIGKVDILFDIDNSSSMGDKQQYLQAAVPDLVSRLVQPNCIDSTGAGILSNGVQLTADATTGQCAMGQAEFPPVHDMHVGVITSSLGGRGTTTICQTMTTSGASPGDYNEYTTGSYQQFLTNESNDALPGGLTAISKNNDDQAHLINRTDPPTAPDAPTSQLTGSFLAWAPTGSMDAPAVDAVTETSSTQLNTDFGDLVVGAQAYGCGIESQLETWYRFLVQPDPYESITTTKSASGLVASWSGVDNTILQQRADFLRPDSLVLIVVLSDEDDSEVDVRTLNGLGVNWLDPTWSPPKATTACATNPGSAQCTSCAFQSPLTAGDPNCMAGTFYSDDSTTWAVNDNLRHVHMKQKYGVDVQFPINRYVLGLTSGRVPNRSGEYPPGGSGYYQGGLASDPADLNCVNPLFAQGLPTSSTGPDDPTICDLTPSTTRTPSSNLVYYAHIGGVPHELLTTTDTTGNVTGVKETLSASDWKLILGNDPENYDYSGIDPHMIESYGPRSGIAVQGGAGATISDDEAPDWVTNGGTSSSPAHFNLPVDREYACVFKLENPDGSANPRNCDIEAASNPESDISSCDCSSSGLSADAVPPVCDPANPLQQDYAKAYPTVRELLLAEKLGTQGIVSSLCPIHLVDSSAHNDPLYGYRPAITAIVDRLEGSLAPTCLPETLAQNDAGVVPCLVLVTLPNVPGQDNSQCTSNPSYPSLEPVQSVILSEFQADQHAEYLQNGGAIDYSTFTTCQIRQVLPASFVNGTCQNNTGTAMGDQGWCYVTGQRSCAQALQFSTNGLPNNGVVSLQCLENSSDFASGNGTGGVNDASTASGDEGTL